MYAFMSVAVYYREIIARVPMGKCDCKKAAVFETDVSPSTSLPLPFPPRCLVSLASTRAEVRRKSCLVFDEECFETKPTFRPDKPTNMDEDDQFFTWRLYKTLPSRLCSCLVQKGLHRNLECYSTRQFNPLVASQFFRQLCRGKLQRGFFFFNSCVLAAAVRFEKTVSWQLHRGRGQASCCRCCVRRLGKQGDKFMRRTQQEEAYIDNSLGLLHFVFRVRELWSRTFCLMLSLSLSFSLTMR